MTILSTILGLFESKFNFVYTGVISALNMIVSEIPDDQIAILHGASGAALTVLQKGGSAEDAMTAGLNYFQAAELSEGDKLLTSLLQAIVTASAANNPVVGS